MMGWTCLNCRRHRRTLSCSHALIRSLLGHQSRLQFQPSRCALCGSDLCSAVRLACTRLYPPTHTAHISPPAL